MHIIRQRNACVQAELTATVRILPRLPLQPLHRKVEVKEDQQLTVILGGVSQYDGSRIAAVITSLPTRGKLYQVNFTAGSAASYATVEKDVTRLEEITSVPTVVKDVRGLVLFRPLQDETNENGEKDKYSSFTYAWIEPLTQTSSVSAFVNVSVLSLNDPPSGQNSIVSLNSSILLLPANATAASQEVVVTLNSTDPDTNFSPYPLYRIKT